TYDCKGSAMCAPMEVKYCDGAVNDKLVRNDDLNYATGGDGDSLGSGVCNGNSYAQGHACGVFIEGKKEDGSACRFSGNRMWWDYQDIHNDDKGGCGKCGAKRYKNGCVVKIDYVTGC
ncbi:hypothetical protein B0H66DRAFT_442042, partial [Apodospora peruviana]